MDRSKLKLLLFICRQTLDKCYDEVVCAKRLVSLLEDIKRELEDYS